MPVKNPIFSKNRIFFDTHALLKIRFFQKACPELERDRIFRFIIYLPRPLDQGNGVWVGLKNLNCDLCYYDECQLGSL
jgi:hypothetical protein